MIVMQNTLSILTGSSFWSFLFIEKNTDSCNAENGQRSALNWPISQFLSLKIWQNFGVKLQTAPKYCGLYGTRTLINPITGRALCESTRTI